jgi:hypothetical protein
MARIGQITSCEQSRHPGRVCPHDTVSSKYIRLDKYHSSEIEIQDRELMTSEGRANELTDKRISQVLQLPQSYPSQSSILHPLELSINLPIRTTSPLLNLFSRLASAVPSASSDWSTAMRHSYFCQALVIPPIPASEPNGLWENLKTQLQARLQEEGGSAKDVEGVLRDVVFWVEGMVVARKADKKLWLAGKAWIGLMDIWISLGRKVSLQGPDTGG